MKTKGANAWSDLSSCMKQDPVSRARRFQGAAIIYCPTKKEVESVGDLLSQHGLSVRLYHAGLPMKQRADSHKAFVHDECDAIVRATLGDSGDTPAIAA